MTSTDLVYSARQAAYGHAGAAKETLTTALPLRVAVTGPVNLTWNWPAAISGLTPNSRNRRIP